MDLEPGENPLSPGSGFVIHPMGGNSRPIWQSRAMAAREVHTLKATGSIPVSAPIASDLTFWISPVEKRFRLEALFNYQ